MNLIRSFKTIRIIVKYGLLILAIMVTIKRWDELGANGITIILMLVYMFCFMMELADGQAAIEAKVNHTSWIMKKIDDRTKPEIELDSELIDLKNYEEEDKNE